MKKIYSESFPWNGSELVHQVYKEDNYYCKKHNNKSQKCIIFFSGNGLYYPNTEQVFELAIIKRNKFEWDNIAKSLYIAKNYEKVIFVRDIFKQWYVTGINDRVDSIEKLYELLKDLCGDNEIVTVGNSAGGYIATLMGYMLNAVAVFSFSGQFMLNAENINYGPIIERYRSNPNIEKYFDVKKFSNEVTKVFYFCPDKVQIDIFQLSYIKNTENVFTFLFDSETHGQTINGKDYPLVLSLPYDFLCNYCKKNENKTISPEQFASDIEPWFYNFYIFSHNCLNKLISIINRLKELLS